MREKVLCSGLVALLLAAVPAIAANDNIDVTELEQYVEDANVKFKGEVRIRGEATQNFTDWDDDGLTALPGSPPGTVVDDSFGYLPYRVRAGLIGKLPKEVYAYVEMQVAGALGLEDARRDVLFSNDSDVDLYMGLIKMNDIGGTVTDLYIGRQELVFDREFLLSNLDFYNGISHDGIRGRWELADGDHTIDGFWFKSTETFVLDADTDFGGIHYSANGVIANGDISAYLIYLREDAVSGLGRSDLYTVGVRVGKMLGDEGGFQYNAELAFQAGNIGNLQSLGGEDATIAALGFEGLFGYGFQGGHEVFVRGYFGSGDDDPTDDEATAFHTLFQDFHNRLGIADAVDGSNITSVSLGYWWKGERNQFGVEIFNFTLSEVMQSSADLTGVVRDTTVGNAITSVPGSLDGLLVTPAAEGQDDIGQEIDILYNFVYSENLDFNVGLAYFDPGDAVVNAAGNVGNTSDAAVRFYGQARLRF